MPRNTRKLPEGVTFMVGAPPPAPPRPRRPAPMWQAVVFAALIAFTAAVIIFSPHGHTEPAPASTGTTQNATP